MTRYAIRPAERRTAKPLIGLYSESGMGKTYSALLLARGFAGPNGKVRMAETEAGRGEAYEDMIPGGYDVISMRDDFSPVAYGEAITAAEQGKTDALIIDSASHEWEGVNGVLAQASANMDAGKKGVLAWQKPKIDHQRHFMLRLLQSPIPLVIVCMRAKYPMVEKPKSGGGKEWTRSEILEPKQADDILFELFVHGWIDAQHRFRATKYTRDDLRTVIIDNEPISMATGERLAAWAKGQTAADSGAKAAVGGGGSAGLPAATSDFPPDLELLDNARRKAEEGKGEFMRWVDTLSEAQKEVLRPQWKDFSSRW